MLYEVITQNKGELRLLASQWRLRFRDEVTRQRDRDEYLKTENLRESIV